MSWQFPTWIEIQTHYERSVTSIPIFGHKGRRGWVIFVVPRVKLNLVTFFFVGMQLWISSGVNAPAVKSVILTHILTYWERWLPSIYIMLLLGLFFFRCYRKSKALGLLVTIEGRARRKLYRKVISKPHHGPFHSLFSCGGECTFSSSGNSVCPVLVHRPKFANFC